MHALNRLFLGTVPVAFFASALGSGLKPTPAAPRARANDNRTPAGVMRGDTLVLRLVVGAAEWYPEAKDGPHVGIEAFSEEGKAPSIPAPLIRVRAGTPIRATVRNALPDSTIHVIGLATQPIPVSDTVHIGPGGSAEMIFKAGAPGTYLSRAVIGNNPDGRPSERETANGAFVVDPVEGSPPDRIFVINILAYDLDSIRVRQALGFNGRAWPYTERLTMTVGDTVHWRIVNGSTRGHPIHLHGFYFRVDAAGNGLASRAIPEAQRRLSVTEQFPPWNTRTYTWSPDRPGNWLLHCHLTFHVVPEARLDHPDDLDHQDHSGNASEHMAGLVLGIEVAPRPGESYERTGTPRRLDLFAHQGPARGSMPMTYSYVLQRGSAPPARDSLEIPSSLLVLTQGQATDIVVHNESPQATGIHWHGIELESFSDGVVGWSNRGKAMAPAIMPGDSFRARLTLPRAGTFLYHTPLNDSKQLTGGGAGPLVVLEPGETFDPARDHVYLASWSGRKRGMAPPPPPDLIVNGDTAVAPAQELAAGVTHRFRLINIGAALNIRFQLRGDTTLVEWKARAKDGADLPPGLRVMQRATQPVAVGETFDFEFTPPSPGAYELTAEFIPPPGVAPVGPRGRWRQRLVVR
jgi:FtsP/CotA-like multicopper oxidase with cupredoxin domain